MSRRTTAEAFEQPSISAAVAKSRLRASLLPLIIPLLLSGCGAGDARRPPPDHATQVPFVLEAVLRYESQQFGPKAGEPDGVICLGIRHDGGLTDPSATILKAIARSQPQSACTGSRTLIAGPVEWLTGDEVRVGGGYIRAAEGETRLAYRVVLEEGIWRCVGPIISRDPL